MVTRWIAEVNCKQTQRQAHVIVTNTSGTHFQNKLASFPRLCFFYCSLVVTAGYCDYESKTSWKPVVFGRRYKPKHKSEHNMFVLSGHKDIKYFWNIGNFLKIHSLVTQNASGLPLLDLGSTVSLPASPSRHSELSSAFQLPCPPSDSLLLTV